MTENLTKAKTKHRKKPKLSTVLALVILIGGVAALLYPTVTSYLNSVEQSNVLNSYESKITNLNPSILKPELQKAEDFNKNLRAGTITDPFGRPKNEEEKLQRSDAYQDYLGILNRDSVMGRIIIPKIDVDLPIYHGTDDHTLRKGIGHLFGTAFPIGGPSTHAVLTGHSAYPEATLFTNLTKMNTGDTFQISLYGELLTYKVDQIKTVTPEQTEDLRVISGEDHITLITCTPYAVNSHRLLVRGVRIENPAGQEATNLPKATATVEIPWNVVAILTGGIVLFTGITLVVNKNNRKKRKHQGSPGEHVQAPKS